MGDRSRAFAAGALLGEIGYWLADRGLDVTISWADPIAGPPTMSVGVNGFDLCRIPGVDCTELFTFRPIDVERVEFIAGLAIGSLVPIVDIFVAIRDTIGSALQGEWGWALFELVAGVVGVVVIGVVDVPNIIKDIGKWVDRFGDVSRRTDDAARFFAKTDDLSSPVRVGILKILRRGSYDTLPGLGIADEDILRLARSRRGLGVTARAIERADEVRLAGRWFDEGARRGQYGREAEEVIRDLTGGTARRLKSDDFPEGQFRTPDAVEVDVDGRPVRAHEVKTGDGEFTHEIPSGKIVTTNLGRQLDKDEILLEKVDRKWKGVALLSQRPPGRRRRPPRPERGRP